MGCRVSVSRPLSISYREDGLQGFRVSACLAIFHRWWTAWSLSRTVPSLHENAKKADTTQKIASYVTLCNIHWYNFWHESDHCSQLKHLEPIILMTDNNKVNHIPSPAHHNLYNINCTVYGKYTVLCVAADISASHGCVTCGPRISAAQLFVECSVAVRIVTVSDAYCW